jgi:hypothetical protein
MTEEVCYQCNSSPCVSRGENLDHREVIDPGCNQRMLSLVFIVSVRLRDHLKGRTKIPLKGFFESFLSKYAVNQKELTARHVGDGSVEGGAAQGVHLRLSHFTFTCRFSGHDDSAVARRLCPFAPWVGR